jgi:uncharacterized protein
MPASPPRVPASGASRSSPSYPSREAVAEVVGKAVAAGGGIVKEAAAGQWGENFGYFSDPDGYLWKVVSAA